MRGLRVLHGSSMALAEPSRNRALRVELLEPDTGFCFIHPFIRSSARPPVFETRGHAVRMHPREATALSGTLAQDRLQRALPEIERTMQRSARHLGQWAYGACDLETGERALLGETERLFPTASVVKLPFHSALGVLAARGSLRFDEPVTVTQEDMVFGSGILQHLTLPITLSLADLAVLMVIVSDNAATNALIRHVGIDTVHRTFQEMGIGDDVILRRPIRDEHAEDDLFGLARPRALLDYLVDLVELRLPGSERTLDVASRQQHRALMAHDLPLQTEGPSRLLVANKTGSDDGVRCDIGIVRGLDRAFAFVMMVDGCPDRSYPPVHPAELAIGEAARITFDALAPEPG